MAVVKSVTIDGESIHVFRNAIYIFESSSGFTLELDLIVSEVVIKKYKTVDNLIVEIELEDGRIINSIMHVKILSGGLPQLNLFCDLDDIQEYADFDRVNENDSWFPNIEDGITIDEIRKVEMPNEDVSIKLNLPINQIEWIKKQKKKSLNEIFQKMINEYWEKQDIK
ncbi:hypothetical protein [Neobacillus drentensis]|uniref:hypothetical protein n=1 Tax=Neobacillus drentensis TaxID=220684 RepID=UPI0028624931|nr:hypothetical protein [Neobacillus drentensis]MDR7236892.1 hypothetical protein [Neobacillus drentensis]